MITIEIPEWIFWPAVFFYGATFLLNILTAVYKRRCAISWDKLSVADKQILGRLRPLND